MKLWQSNRSILAVCAILVAGVFSGAWPITADGADETRLGESVSLQGYMGIYGNQMHQATVLAVEEVNQQGGINGRKIKLFSYDEASSREQVLSVMERLIQSDQVLAIHGPSGTAMAKVGWPYSVRFGVPVITSTTAPGMTDIGPCTFRYSLPESELYPIAVKLVAAKLHPKTAVLVYAKDEAYSATNAPFMKRALEANGITILAETAHTMQDVNYSALVTRIKGLKPDLIAITTLPEPGINLIREARRMGLTQTFVGGNAFNTPKIIELGASAAEGLIVGTPWFIGNAAKGNKSFVEAYGKRWNQAPDQFAAQGYQGMQVIFTALRNTQLTGDTAKDRAALCRAMTEIKDVPGPLEPFNFDATRSPKPTGISVIQVKRGTFALFE